MLHASSRPDPETAKSRDPSARGWLIVYLAAWAVFLGLEYHHQRAGLTDRHAPVEWLLQADGDTLVYLALLVAAPFVWWLGRGEALRRVNFFGKIARRIKARAARFEGPSWTMIRPVCFSLLAGAVSLAASATVGAHFQGLPPAYHDEYSYLFQAETFLAGRVSFPSHEAAHLFDQMHILNEGRFASRYFPGAGLWMAPFVAIDRPYWGHWLAGAICAVLMFWIGRELAGDAAGLIAGLLTALSPGMALFSNLLLAHHPTLVGLGIFILGALRLVRSASLGWSLVTGAGLAFAVLCRPMTAVGVALPFGVYLLWWARLQCKRRLLALAAMGMPLVAAGIGLALYDRAITGSLWTTPYGLYTEIYTPRHVYGFNNVVRGEKHLGPRVIENYDRWAENLTPALAAENAARRLYASWRWTLGLIPLTLALAGGLLLWRRLPCGIWLILAAIVSLHAVHVPYWFIGIEDHHYVFESGPLWAVWTGVVSIEALRAWRAVGHTALGCWWGTLLVAAVTMNFGATGLRGREGSGKDPAWSAPLERAENDVAFARRKHGRFFALVAQQARQLPALVLVEVDPADRHIDYVTNRPGLTDPILIGRFIPDRVPIAEVKRLFPDRHLYLYKVREDEWRRLD